MWLLLGWNRYNLGIEDPDLLKLEEITAEALPNSKASPARRVAQLLMAYSGDAPEFQNYIEDYKVEDGRIKIW